MKHLLPWVFCPEACWGKWSPQDKLRGLGVEGQAQRGWSDLLDPEALALNQMQRRCPVMPCLILPGFQLRSNSGTSYYVLTQTHVSLDTFRDFLF